MVTWQPIVGGRAVAGVHAAPPPPDPGLPSALSAWRTPHTRKSEGGCLGKPGGVGGARAHMREGGAHGRWSCAEKKGGVSMPFAADSPPSSHSPFACKGRARKNGSSPLCTWHTGGRQRGVLQSGGGAATVGKGPGAFRSRILSSQEWGAGGERGGGGTEVASVELVRGAAKPALLAPNP